MIMPGAADEESSTFEGFVNSHYGISLTYSLRSSSYMKSWSHCTKLWQWHAKGTTATQSGAIAAEAQYAQSATRALSGAPHAGGLRQAGRSGTIPSRAACHWARAALTHEHAVPNPEVNTECLNEPR